MNAVKRGTTTAWSMQARDAPRRRAQQTLGGGTQARRGCDAGAQRAREPWLGGVDRRAAAVDPDTRQGVMR